MAGQTGPTGPTGANGANGSTGPTGSAASNYTATAAVAATDNNGIIINNTTHQIKLEFADATHNGIVSTTTQDFNGVKIFLTEVQTPIVTNPNDTIRIASTATQYPIGPGALVGVVTGTGLVAIGDNALAANTSGSDNIAIGFGAMQNAATSTDIAIGHEALQNDTAGTNIAIGYQALQSNTTGSLSVAIGYQAMMSATGGGADVAVGYQALQNDQGSANTAVGALALNQNLSGINNTAMGLQAMYNNTSGQVNTAIGAKSLSANISGDMNVAIGSEVMITSQVGAETVAVGAGALGQIFGGTGNIAIGTNAGFNFTGVEGFNIDIGNQGVAGDNNTIRLGTNGVHLTNYQQGIAGVLVANNTPVLIDTVTGQLGTLLSSRRYKDHIHDMDDFSSAILQLRPVTFTYKADENQKQQVGVIAEEVEEVMEFLVIKNEQGQVESVKQHDLVFLMLNEMIKQQRQIDALQTQLNKLLN